MIKTKDNSSTSAETADEQRAEVEDISVSPACIKPNVVGCANVLQQLKAKAKSNYKDKVRMPSIKQIKKLLDAYGITSYMDEHTNVVEYRSKGKMYVNSRHMGKKGLRLKIPDASIELDTSSSYYSYNTWRYAEEIIKLVEAVHA